MADKRDYYEVLGLKKGASDDDIKKAYRKAAKENHPDLHPGDKQAEARFKEANEAYAVLSDPEKRAQYDQFGFAGVDPNFGAGGFSGDFSDLGDIFGDFFNGFGFGGFGGGTRTQSRNGPRQGEPIRTRITISFEEAASGCKKEISVNKTEQCPDCHGSGCAPGTSVQTCPACQGRGVVTTNRRTPIGVIQSSSPCQQCGGTGKIIRTPCPKCRGNGFVRAVRQLSVNIPAGIDNGDTVSLRGEGNAGMNGGPPGDLLVEVQVKPNPNYHREGTNLYTTVSISFVQAALGTDIEVTTLGGSVNLTIPEGTQTGSVFRLRGKGVPNVRTGERGDQYVTVNLLTPKNLNHRERELLQEFAEVSGQKVGKKKRIF